MIDNIGGIMLKELVAFANHLDSRGLTKEADMVDSIVRKYAQEEKTIQHTVQKDETVSEIALGYGINQSSAAYRQIIEDNFEGKDYQEKLRAADMIMPGKVLKIPMDETSEELFVNPQPGSDFIKQRDAEKAEQQIRFDAEDEAIKRRF